MSSSTQKDTKEAAQVEEAISISSGGVDQSSEDSFLERWLKKLEVQPKGNLTTAQMFLYNYDLRPVEEARREWNWFSYVSFWIADSFNINTFQIASTAVANGMNWWLTWISVWIGYSITGCFVYLAARIGSHYHISFPVSCRASFGIFGCLWPVINRVCMSVIWFSVQSWIGGQCIQLSLRSIFGNNLDTKIHNGIPNSGTTTFQFMSLFIFWLFTLPFLWLPPHKMRHFFTIKAVISPIAGIALLAWTIAKAHGIGPIVHQKSSLEGSDLAWEFVNSVMNSLANFATLIVNAPDFSRFAKTKDSAAFSQLLAIPISFSITSLIGILISSASTVMFGETYWSPLDVLGRFLDDYTSKNRAGVFFISFMFVYIQIVMNLAANNLSFATDATSLLPRFINIRRGCYLCAIIGLGMCPWNFYSSSNKFTTYLSAYTVFLSSIAGVLICDYYVVRRGYIDLSHLYTNNKHCYYSYGNRLGANWRAYVAYICGILPNIVGFVGATGTHKVPIGATYVYNINFFSGFLSAFFVYALCCYLSPIAGTPVKGFFEKGWFEEWQDVEEFTNIMDGALVTAAHKSGEEKEYTESY